MKKNYINNFKDKILRYIHKSIYKPGHYYSAVPNPIEIENNSSRIFKDVDVIPGVELNVSKQLAFLQKSKSLLHFFPYLKNEDDLRYKLPNNFFGTGDVLSLFLIFKSFNPSKVIEIGSGYSSAAMLDFNDLFFESKIQFDFIEPYPDRLNSLLKNGDKNIVKIHQKFVQEFSVDFFKKLDEDDILFIDSSHVSKIGSDVNFLFLEVLPVLKKGVIIHIHDIGFPFEYSKDWIDYGIYWNEAYLLKAFMSFNTSFEILLWNDFISKKKSEEVKNIDPILEKLGGGSIWLRKLVD